MSPERMVMGDSDQQDLDEIEKLSPWGFASRQRGVAVTATGSRLKNTSASWPLMFRVMVSVCSTASSALSCLTKSRVTQTPPFESQV